MKRIIFLAVICGLLLSSCQNEPFLYRDHSARIWAGQGTGSILVQQGSFRQVDPSVDEMVIYVPMSITGMPSQTDRTFRLEVVTDLDTAGIPYTNVATEDFSLGPMIVPANVLTFTYPITVRRNVIGIDGQGIDLTLAPNAADLRLRFVPNEYFLNAPFPHPEEFTVRWIDYHLQPTWWVGLFITNIGAFTQQRYQFMINVTGTEDFSGYVGMARLMVLQALLRQALRDYEDEHGTPFLNDNGLPLTFP